MRRVLPGDIAATARVLYSLPEADRKACLEGVLRCAERAELYRLQNGRAHPSCGTGSLMAATSRMERAPEPDFSDVEYCKCWILTLQAVMRWRTAAPRPAEYGG